MTDCEKTFATCEEKKKLPQFHILKNQQSTEKTGKGNEQVIYNK